MRKISDQELIDEMKRVFAETNEVPKTVTWNTKSKISLDAYRRAFGSWENALKAAGIQKEEKDFIVKERIIIDIKKAYIANKDLNVNDLIRSSGHSLPTIMKYFGSVDSLLKISKIDLNNRTSKEEFINDYIKIYAKLNRIPTSRDLDTHSKYAANTFRRRFGSLEAVAEEAGIQKGDAPLKVSDEDLLFELKRISDELGRVPMTEDVDYKTKYSVNSYIRAFGSFDKALKQIGLSAVKQTKINQICSICGLSSVSMISHFTELHPDELKKQEQLVVGLFKDGLSARKIATRDDVIFKGGTSVTRVIRKYLSSEEIESLRVCKITSKLKQDYADGKYEWVNELNRNRNTTTEAKEKNSEGLKEAYASGEKEAWNKGLTKETDQRVAKSSELISEARKSAFSSGELEKKIGPEASNWNEDREEVARRYRLGLDFSAEARSCIKKRAEYKCEKCGICQEQLEELSQTLECDHIIPIFKGGLDDWQTNAQALCPKCHREKSMSDLKKYTKCLT